LVIAYAAEGLYMGHLIDFSIANYGYISAENPVFELIFWAILVYLGRADRLGDMVA